ncbi:hypothetical protein FA15DRAFT_704537 [Coprinopsis marcescibilis]|uniref:BTB domain-containing protein n=1 Tax=Coprinopsis marcescibilis TaxID=230819 RepID=A0A5C3KX84_COPMA|nr:hypothetical protein FA15DRAFT_704537 [Coprinopsis marcescibilis]
MASSPESLSPASSLISYTHSEDEIVDVTVTGVEGDNSANISTSFYPGSHSLESDVILVSNDDVMFCVHTETIANVDKNAFASSMPPHMPFSTGTARGAAISVNEDSTTLSIILHAIYGTSSAHYSLGLEALLKAVNHMPHHGIVPEKLITPTSPLSQQLQSVVPYYPIEIYTLAGHHKLEFLAQRASSHLLSFKMHTLTDGQAEKMGPSYLRRLFNLHLGRLASLKALLTEPPQRHPPSKHCTFHDQERLRRSWSLASAYLLWEARPDLPVGVIQTTLDSLIKVMWCEECKTASKARVRDATFRWASVKVGYFLFPSA